MINKKIFIYIENELFLNNLVNNNTFKYLEKNFQCYYILNYKLKSKINNFLNSNQKKKLLNKILYFYEYDNFSFKIYSLIFFRNQIRNKLKSKNTRLILSNKLYFKFKFEYEKSIQSLIKRYILHIFNFFSKTINEILLFKVIDRVLCKFIKQDEKLISLISKYKPNLIVIPFSGTHISIYDTIRYCNASNASKVFLLSENWDSVFSRFFLNYPNYMSVWGAQAKKFFLKKQSNKTKVFNLGSPRLQPYFNFQKKINNKKKFTISYYDRATPDQNKNKEFFDYIEALLNTHKFKKKITLLYKPHPYTYLKFIKIFNFNKFKNIKLAEEYKKFYNFNNVKSKIKSSTFKNELNSLNQSDLIITNATSIALEASILYKNVLIFSPDSNNSFFNDRKAKVYEQFKNIDKIKNIKFCYNLDEIGREIINFYTKEQKINKTKIDKSRKFFLEKPKIDFSRSLYKCIKKLI